MTDNRSPLLVIEDGQEVRQLMHGFLDDYNVVPAQDHDTAIAQVRRHEPKVVMLDLGLPPSPDTPEEGLRILASILSIAPGTKVIALTRKDDRDDAVKAVQAGAFDFFCRPFEPEVLALVIDRARHLAGLEEEIHRLSQRIGKTPLSGLITRDPGMLRVCRQIEKLAPTDATVTLIGESGTGKEVLARGLHQLSGRREYRFVAINCAAIPETLLESELFGYERGAFTGAVRQTPGKIELANGGTLFLDEIGDLPFSLQAKLLRFLQERVVERIGGREEIPVDVRIVCATHRRLRDLIVTGDFREDLYYRLTEMVVEIPPLRERAGDAALLAHNFIRRLASQQGKDRLTLADDALKSIECHPWPGNVRELQNCLKRAVILADGQVIRPEDLGLAREAADLHYLNLRQAREEAERAAVLRAMAHTNGNIARAAEILGISRPTLYDLLNRFNLR